MSKVLRLYTGGTNTYQDWNSAVAFPYDSTARQTIQDPDGATAKHEITSIPSPFARIDLVKMAFSEVCRSKKLDGNSIFHKMVSDTLDVGELFFNYSKLSDKIEIITWDCAKAIAELKSSNSDGHRYYGDALEKYLDSDKKTYNFDKLRNIYLLNYKHGPAPLNIIGATSPATLFFSTANSLDYVNDIFFAHDKPFDNDYQPLYARADVEYIKFWFVLRNSIPGFANLFPEVDEYLELTYKALTNEELKQQLRTINSNATGFDEITVNATTLVNTVEVLGFNLYQKGEKKVESGFEIVSTIYQGELPLVLPIDAGNSYAEVPYVTGKWGNTNRAPYYDNEADINKRSLPFDGSTHAYLTISDLLEDDIIKVPHKLNSECFFDGNCMLDNKEKLAFLLPLKKEFFKFFTAKELMEGLPTGKKMIEMQLLAGESVKVTIRIPIKGDGRNVDCVEYSRIYYGGSNKSDIEKNQGGIFERDFAGFMMPNVKFNNPNEAIYTVGCISDFSKKCEMSFYDSKGKIHQVISDCRNTNDPSLKKTIVYTVDKSNFEYIHLTDRIGGNGIIIPRFGKQLTNDEFCFAIDLGTSNTHIEFVKNNGTVPHEFSVDKENSMMCKMFVPHFIEDLNIQDDLTLEDELMGKDFLPSTVGENSDFYFPTRTVLSYSKNNIDWQKSLFPFGLINIPLTFNKRKELSYNAIEDNIKWGKDNIRRMMEAYIDCLMLLIRNKVVLEGGRLDRTKIMWFYPISMAPRRLNMLRTTWNAAYSKYFGQGETSYMTESEAPIQYYFRRHAEATNLVNVDIGGGTTDIAFAKDKNIQCVTSFRFASNALFQDSFSEANIHNGIIDHFMPIYSALLNGKDLKELPAIFVSNEEKPASMAMFLFSLSSNTLAQNLNKNEIDFTAKLRDDENFKIIFVLFYVSIIYHIAQIVKVKELELPRHITFSGNGSKVLSVLTTNNKDLSALAKVVFEHVLGKPYNNALDILGITENTNPKKSTCKGGLIAKAVDEVDRSKMVVLRSDGTAVVTNSDTYDTIDEEYISNVVSSVESFFDFALIGLNQKFDLDAYFGVSPNSLKIAKDICKNDIKTYVKKGLALMKEEAEGNNKLDETLFFYPIKGVLQSLSTAISSNYKQS